MMCRLCICEVERIQLARCSMLLASGCPVSSLDWLIQDLWVLRYQVVQSHAVGVWS